MTHLGRHRPGFSLVEILIVITIIGILAAIAVPKFANASQMARENTLKDDLRLLRTQIGVYRSQHNDVSPGYPAGDMTRTPTVPDLLDQLSHHSDSRGNTSEPAAPQFPYGPYLVVIPDNPISGKSGWKILGPADPLVADGSTAWLYQPSTGIIKANVTGTDSLGVSIIDY